MDPIKIIQKYYDTNSLAYKILLGHSWAVAQMAIKIAKRLSIPNIDLQFIEEAALLHDIGIIKIDASGIGCFGNEPYLLHGILGRKMLEKEGLFRHAMVCERHIGIGLTAEMIANQKLPLPSRDMVPTTLEEEIICYADCFFSKNLNHLTEPKDLAKIRRGLIKYKNPRIAVFEAWVRQFGT